jgi:hypothetical protein
MCTSALNKRSSMTAHLEISQRAQVPAKYRTSFNQNVAQMQHTGHVSAWLDLLEKITGGVTQDSNSFELCGYESMPRGLRKNRHRVPFGCRISIAFPQSFPTAGIIAYGLNPLFFRCIFSAWALPRHRLKHNTTLAALSSASARSLVLCSQRAPWCSIHDICQAGSEQKAGGLRNWSSLDQTSAG